MPRPAKEAFFDHVRPPARNSTGIAQGTAGRAPLPTLHTMCHELAAAPMRAARCMVSVTPIIILALRGETPGGQAGSLTPAGGLCYAARTGRVSRAWGAIST